jgi:hypothetical protein
LRFGEKLELNNDDADALFASLLCEAAASETAAGGPARSMKGEAESKKRPAPAVPAGLFPASHEILQKKLNLKLGPEYISSRAAAGNC